MRTRLLFGLYLLLVSPSLTSRALSLVVVQQKIPIAVRIQLVWPDLGFDQVRTMGVLLRPDCNSVV